MFYCEYCFYFIFVHRCYHDNHMMMNVTAVIIFFFIFHFHASLLLLRSPQKRMLYHVMLVTTYTVLVNCIPTLLPLFFILAVMVINTFLFHSVHIFCHQGPRKLKNTVCSVGKKFYLLHTSFCVNTKYVYRSDLKMFLF